MGRIVVVVLILGTLVACGSRLNPLNWFGNDREERIEARATDAAEQEAENPIAAADPRALVDEIVSLDIEQTSQGAIIRVTGRAATQGFWQVGLLQISREDGALVYQLRAMPPEGAIEQGTPTLREVVAGAAISPRELAGLRSVTVEGAQNRRTVTR